MRQVTRSKRPSSKGSASIAGDHAGHMRREGGRRVAGAGGNVKRLPGGLRLYQLHQAAEACALGVHR